MFNSKITERRQFVGETWALSRYKDIAKRTDSKWRKQLFTERVGGGPVYVAVAPTPEVVGPTILGLAFLSAQAPGGVQFAVLGGGVRMPLIEVAEKAPPAPAPLPAAATAAAAPAIPYVAPVYPRTQDRN